MGHKEAMRKPDKILVSRQKRKSPSVRLVAFTSQELKKLRNEFKVNQRDMAKSLGVEQGLISHLETGRSKPSFDILSQTGRYFSQLAGYKIVFYADHSNEKDEPDQFWGKTD